MAEIGGWQDLGGDLHDGVPDDAADVAAVRFMAADPDTGQDRWFTALGPFPDLDYEDWDQYLDDWYGENYGEA